MAAYVGALLIHLAHATPLMYLTYCTVYEYKNIEKLAILRV